jgi:hypothetical protein
MSDIHCYSGYPAYPGDCYQLIARMSTAYIVIRKEKKRKEKNCAAEEPPEKLKVWGPVILRKEGTEYRKRLRSIHRQ